MIDLTWERKIPCCRCGLGFARKADITADHLKPKVMGLDNSLANLAPAHGRCNKAAGGRLGHRVRRRR